MIGYVLKIKVKDISKSEADMILYINRVIGLIALVVLTFCMFIGGCCSPDVAGSMLSPEAKNIKAWLIELVEDSTMANSSSMIDNIRAETKSKYSKEEYCLPYLKNLENNLRSRGYHIVDGPVTEGTIRIDIEGYKELFWIIRVGHEDGWQEELEWDSRGDPTEGHLGGEEIMVDALKALQEDEVKSVQLEFFDFNGRLLGQAKISGCKIKPEFIARVIDKMIKEGKY